MQFFETQKVLISGQLRQNMIIYEITQTDLVLAYYLPIVAVQSSYHKF